MVRYLNLHQSNQEGVQQAECEHVDLTTTEQHIGFAVPYLWT
jgi:hypothetical protein